MKKLMAAPVAVAAVKKAAIAVGPAGANTYTTSGPTLASGGVARSPRVAAAPVRASTPHPRWPGQLPGHRGRAVVRGQPAGPDRIWSGSGSRIAGRTAAHTASSRASRDGGGTTWSKNLARLHQVRRGTAHNGASTSGRPTPWPVVAESVERVRDAARDQHLVRPLDGPQRRALEQVARRRRDTGATRPPCGEDNSNSGPLANLFNDKESITADPVDTNNVYAVWDRIESPNNNPLTPPQATRTRLPSAGRRGSPAARTTARAGSRRARSSTQEADADDRQPDRGAARRHPRGRVQLLTGSRTVKASSGATTPR